MKNYRIKQIGDKYYPQERTFFFYWVNIKLYDKVSRDWFFQSVQDNIYNDTVNYFACKYAWGSTKWLQPEFKTLELAKLFIEEYKNFLKRKYENQKAKYYY